MRSKFVSAKSFFDDMRDEILSLGNCQEGFLLDDGKFLDFIFLDKRFAINLVPIRAQRSQMKEFYLKELSLSSFSQGICVYHIFEYDWWKNKKALINFLKAKLNFNENKKVARAYDYKVREIKEAEYLDFFKENSFLSSNKNKVERFFMLGDRLAALATGGEFGKLKQKTSTLGFVTSNKVKVVGSLGKLVSFAADRLQKEITLSFEMRLTDLRTCHFNSSKLNFLRFTDPKKIAFRSIEKQDNHFAMKKIENVDRLDSNFVKTLCFTHFDSALSYESNLENNDYKIFFDAGSLVFNISKK